MINTVLIGFGNVGFHLAKAFQKAPKINLLQIYNRSTINDKVQENLQVDFTTRISDLKEADVYIIAVKDDAIESLITAIPYPEKIVAHTSGSLALQATPQKDAVFYPLQTFSKNKNLDYRQIPFCLEAEDENTFSVVEKMGRFISAKVYAISSLQRQQLHLSAVFVCNFVNHLYAIGEEICQQHQIPFHILDALIAETAEKVRTLSPYEAQTGPAIRNDSQTMERHLNQLKQNDYKEIYKQLSNSILKKHGYQL